MILPSNVKDLSYEELVKALIEDEGYEEAAAIYVAKRVKGKLPNDKRPLM